MNRQQLRALLDAVQAGLLSPEAAQDRLFQVLRQKPFEDLGFARLDHHRATRQGFPEVIFGQGKTAEQVAAIAERIVAAGHALLVTRTTAEAYSAVQSRIPDAVYHDLARCISRPVQDTPRGVGRVVVAAAGTADLPVAEEAAVTADVMGNDVDRLFDVGVAGLHRLLSEHDRLTAARVVIVVAGMEGA
ncbi:MAG: AIR carboxylase family protein, partial [Vicinamibacterales bacterium]